MIIHEDNYCKYEIRCNELEEYYISITDKTDQRVLSMPGLTPERVVGFTISMLLHVTILGRPALKTWAYNRVLAAIDKLRGPEAILVARVKELEEALRGLMPEACLVDGMPPPGAWEKARAALAAEEKT